MEKLFRVEPFFNLLAELDHDPVVLENHYDDYRCALLHSDADLCTQIYSSIKDYLQDLKDQGIVDDKQMQQYLNHLAPEGNNLF